MGEDAQADLLANRCWSNSTGIGFLGSAKGKARENDCSENEHSGILLNDDAVADLEENVLNRTGCGIVFWGCSGGTARGNTCQDNRENGIYILRPANPILEKNRFKNNAYGDIEISEALLDLLE